MSETPLIDDQNKQELLNQPFDGIPADDDAFIMSQEASRRILENDAAPEATVGGVVPPTFTGEKAPNTKLRLTTRGKVVAGGALSLALATGAGLGVAAAVDAAAEKPPVATTTITVEPGDGGQSLMQKGDPEVAAGTEDWRDALDRASHLPQNSEVLAPGHVLKPGETVTIPLDQPEK